MLQSCACRCAGWTPLLSLSLPPSLSLSLSVFETNVAPEAHGREREADSFFSFLSTAFLTPPPFHIHSDSADDLWGRLAVDGYSISTQNVDNYIKERTAPHGVLTRRNCPLLFSWFPLDLLALITSPLTPWPCRRIMIRCSPSFKLSVLVCDAFRSQHKATTQLYSAYPTGKK